MQSLLIISLLVLGMGAASHTTPQPCRLKFMTTLHSKSKSGSQSLPCPISQVPQFSVPKIPQLSVSQLPHFSAHQTHQYPKLKGLHYSMSQIPKSSKYSVTESSLSQVPKLSISDGPEFHMSQIPQFSKSEVPQFSVSETPKFSAFQVPQFSMSETPKFSASQVPHFSMSEISRFSVSQTPKFSASETPQYSVSEISKLHISQTPQFSMSEIPQSPTSNVPPFTVSNIPLFPVPKISLDFIPEISPLPKIQGTPIPEIQITPIPEIQITPIPEIQIDPIPEIQVTPIPEIQIDPIPAIQIPTIPEIQIPPIPAIQIPTIPEIQIPPIPEIQITPIPEIQTINDIQVDPKPPKIQLSVLRQQFTQCYTKPKLRGRCTLITTAVPELGLGKFDNQIQSVFQSGMWLYYESINYNDVIPGRVFYVIGTFTAVTFPFQYRNVVSSVRPIGGENNEYGDMLISYQGEGFTGAQHSWQYNDPFMLEEIGRISSIIVTGMSPWTVYSGEYYTGNSLCVYPDIYPANYHTQPYILGMYINITMLGLPNIISARKGCWASFGARPQSIRVDGRNANGYYGRIL
ncbi:uncharacterized protein LOC135103602 isoform X2 [Scylla paramamosain]|uniref:uncharacterized protein LOC135103602 isoform X2 n=1 Tax=Scylla paramamosain TaxID=85552 RepID=UPI003083DA83